MESLQQFMSNVPLVVETPVYDNLTYFCESSWVQEEGGYRCVDTGALEQCTWLNEESQNCLVERVQVGTHQETQYQRAWVDRAVVSAPVAQPESLHGLLPTDYEVTMQSAEPIEILPGQTVYFKVVLASTAPGPQAFALFVHGNTLSGDLISTHLAEETVLLAEEDAGQKDARAEQVNRRLSPQTSFDGDDVPKFTFKFTSQRSLLTQAASAFLGIDSEFTVRSATLRHVGGESEDVPVHIVYEENGEWNKGRNPRWRKR
jgi:hypothetical protein